MNKRVGLNIWKTGQWVLLIVLLVQVKVSAKDSDESVRKLTPVQVKDVRVGGELGRRIDLALKNNILPLDVDKHLLNHFRDREEGGYVGLGKLIDAYVHYSIYTNDEAVKAKKNYLVKTAIDNQEKDGYIGKINKDNRMFQGATWDIHEMSYIIYSLSQNYRYFQDRASLESAEKAAQYIMSNWGDKPADWQESINVAETVALTGLEEAMVNLYDLTGDRKYLDFLLQERDFENWDLDIVIGRRPLIEGHIYSFHSRLLAQLKLYALYPSPGLLGQTAKAFDFMVNRDGMVITGGVGQMEIWDDSQDGRSYLAESCATAYFNRVCNQLVQLTGDSYYGDLMERSIYNSLLGALSPDCEHTRYYTPFEGPREYSPHTSYCCNNNLRRMLPALPGMVFLTGSHSLAVNLYVDSEADIVMSNNKQVRIRQVTDYPSTGKVKIQLVPESEISFNLMLRIPSWSKKAAVSVNGERIDAAPVSGQFFVINRVWTKDDEVEILFDMQPRLIAGVKKQSGRVALMRGPLLYCLNPGNAGNLNDLDGASLGHITLDPETLELVGDESVRPNGTAFIVRIWPPGDHRTLPYTGPERRKGHLIDLHEIKLTEFADPEGLAVYFELQDLSIAVPDELFGEKSFEMRGFGVW